MLIEKKVKDISNNPVMLSMAQDKEHMAQIFVETKIVLRIVKTIHLSSTFKKRFDKFGQFSVMGRKL